MHHLLGFVDILCIQEHFLYRYEEPLLEEMLSEFHFSLKCVDDEDPISPTMKGKGMHGTATIWNDKVNNLITPHEDGSHRCLLTQVGDAHPIFLLNTYMPTSGHTDDYKAVLDEVAVIYEKYSSTGDIIWLGDLNGDPTRINSSENDKLLTEAAKEQIGKTPLGRKMRFWLRSGILSLLDILSRENVLVLEAVLIATKFQSILITSETVILNWMHQLGRMNVD